jgi:hypothetical protein
MKTHKAETVAVGEKVLNKPAAVLDKTYESDIKGMLSDDGSFDPAAVKVVAESLVALKILPKEPTPKEMYDGAFVPVKLDK